MTINPKIYDTLKWLAMIVLPALATFVALVGPEWGLPKVDAITVTITALGALLGAVTAINKVAYDRSDEKYDGVISPEKANRQTGQDALAFYADAGDVDSKKEIILKVE